MESTPDGPRLVVASDELHAAASAFVSRLVAWFEEHAVPTSATELAALPPESRKELEQVLGKCALETAVIATAPNRILWTDDGVASLVVIERFGTRRIWTQAAFDWLAREGRVEADRHSRLSARMIGWGYSFTSANDRILRTAGLLADWEVARQPLKQGVEYLGLAEVRPKDALFLAAFLVRDAYLHAAIPERRRAILLAVLDALRGRSDLTDRAIDELGAALPRLFGLHVIGCEDALKTLAAWRAGAHRIVRV